MGQDALLLSISCSALSVALLPALLIGLKPALLLGFSLVVALCITVPFVLSIRQWPPRGVLGDYPILSMYVGYHTHGYPPTFTFSVRHRVRLVGPGTCRLELCPSSTCSQTSNVPTPKPSLAKVTARRIGCPTSKS